MNRVTLAIVLFFSAALILYWQVQVKRSAKDSQAASSLIQPDFVADDLKSVEFTESGKVSSRVSASHMEHYNQTQMTYFTNPVYQVYPDTGEGQWHLYASQGSLDKLSGKVVLENNVIIDAIEPNEPIQRLTTSYLELDLNTMIMTSDEPIYIKGSGFTVTGKGLYADLNTQTIELKSQIEGTYEPK
ncbi:LPS export ABC transporter periplasmic protein LptC [Shewanella sp. NIFS-20-20]|uniref:LPS export ABC transporter periplasmic protein LptC n=1 Tax=Shewanella sp. NIFS-20-20 TaxID=2853806 RepID=UPI001C44C9E3|nr:LPS export ABC transporter periplasmic protein LptC [Shewanella sp. NIFS-20-20]MBV7316156.1 LPS export ABC transporter periplasmic protein LptC [Shewanella sp. NIFS-20-20]